eukprot:CAMPEP_0184698378 /NCGR_PEP_ID=MMETSP0313-20130426/5025_1 /TAXON_ID=2792 /ORGANISM="Porphyridium aerugineum, Strain SAG 1380-2" /LENGTH=376 /DNA_ID=CAMNT_0027157313 /DNA_START=41 /DNA_END=1171 /DNA_ORIENTATION=+
MDGGNEQPLEEQQQPPASAEHKSIQPLVYDLEPSKTFSSPSDYVQKQLDEAQRKNEARAARFGIEVRKPKDTNVLGVKRYMVDDVIRSRRGMGIPSPADFVTGFDVASQEELTKAQMRAKRFGLDKKKDEAPVASASTSVKEESPAPEGEASGEPRDASSPLATPDQPRLIVSKPLEPKRNVNLEFEQIRPFVLHVYGIDTLSTEKLLELFGLYSPSWVEWINDSTANIAFAEEFTPKRVLLNLGLELEVGPDQWQTISEENAAIQDSTLTIWRKSRYVTLNNGITVQLQMRCATDQDRRPDKPNPRSSWSRTNQQRQSEGYNSRRGGYQRAAGGVQKPRRESTPWKVDNVREEIKSKLGSRIDFDMEDRDEPAAE